MENRETIKRLRATAAGLGAWGLLVDVGAWGLLEVDVGEDWGSGMVSGEDGLGSKERSSSHS